MGQHRILEIFLLKPSAGSGGKEWEFPQFADNTKIVLITLGKPILTDGNNATIFLAFDFRLSSEFVVGGQDTLEGRKTITTRPFSILWAVVN